MVEKATKAALLGAELCPQPHGLVPRICSELKAGSLGPLQLSTSSQQPPVCIVVLIGESDCSRELPILQEQLAELRFLRTRKCW